MNTNQADLRQEWIRLAPTWIKQARERTMASRDGLLDRPMLEACGDVRGSAVLDSGCGEGRFSRILVERGAERVLGIDACEPMIHAARELQSAKESYRVTDAEDLSFLEDRSFDLAISYLNQCDLLDFKANTREVFRVLKLGGRFVVANVHPMRSATGTWQTSEDGSKQHAVLDNYFEEGERHWKMLECDFTNFHRTLSTYVKGFREPGFLIHDIIEPTVDANGLARFPDLADEKRVPNFIIFVLIKPEASQNDLSY
jgi:ubiquinone/menaquinone biosynthesis C-methylase UbiE